MTIDGGEGGTGAAPLAFSDHVALPFKLGYLARLPDVRARPGSPRTWSSSAPAGSASRTPALHALALGCDMINVGREAMLAIGCIQAQRCHTGSCPTGVATNNTLADARPRPRPQVRAGGELRRRRCAPSCSRSAGRAARAHPALIDPDRIEIVSVALPVHAAARGVRLRGRAGRSCRRPGGSRDRARSSAPPSCTGRRRPRRRRARGLPRRGRPGPPPHGPPRQRRAQRASPASRGPTR